MALFVLTKRSNFVTQRFIGIVDGQLQSEMLRTESDLFQSFGVGTKPQIALTVGISRMYLIGKTPFFARHAIIEWAQAITLSIKIRKASSIRMQRQSSKRNSEGVKGQR